MITAKKAKEKVIKSVHKRTYIKKIREQIEDAIEDGYFERIVTIDEYDDIDYDINKTLFHILRYFEYYGYEVIVHVKEKNRLVIEVRWHNSYR